MTASRKQRLRSMRLYALLSESQCRRSWQETARLLLEAGAEVIQLREKTLEDAELLARARTLRRLVDGFDGLFIVNDRPDVALLSGADGVHVGQQDLPVQEVRRLVGPDMIVGLSTHSPEQAGKAEAQGADYVGVGPVFPTQTKGYRQGGGPELVARLCAATRLPTVAVGGLTPANAASVLEAGAQAIAACSALCGADDPADAARTFLKAFRRQTPGTAP